MGDRPLRIQDDFETMQRLMNELEYEKKQYEKEIEREMQLTAELECKTETAKQEDKLNKEATRQQDEEGKLLNNQCVQNKHNYISLQEACDILSEQEKNLSSHLKELINNDEKAREKKKTAVDHYEAVYKSYQEKYETYPLAVQRKQKEGELSNWEENYNEAKLRAEETAKKLTWVETTASQKAGTSVNEFPVFKNQNEFIIRLAEIKLTFNELSAELERKTHCCDELKKTAGERVKAKRQMEEEKKKDELKRIAEQRASEEKSNAEKMVRAEAQRQEERRQQSGEGQRRNSDEWQMMEDARLRKQNQNTTLQMPFRRPEMTSPSLPPSMQATTAFHQRLPPKIFLPTRQMPFQQKDAEIGVFRPPLPPKDMRYPLAVAGKRIRFVETPVAIEKLAPRFDAATAITAGLIPRQKLYPDDLVATATLGPLRQPPCREMPVETATPVHAQQPLCLERLITTPALQPRQPSCSEEASTGMAVLSERNPCREAGGGIASCLKNLSIHGQMDQNFLMETEDEETLPPGFSFSRLPSADSSNVTQSGFDQQSDAGDQENLMVSSVARQDQEVNLEMRKDAVSAEETPMSTDEDDQFPSLESSMASAADFKNNWRPPNSAIVSSGDSVMLDDSVSLSSTPIADCVVTSSINRSVSLPLDTSSSSCFVSETVASSDGSTASSNATSPPIMTQSSNVHLHHSASEETTVTSQVSGATAAASPVGLDRPTASMSAAESELCAEESGAATDFTNSLEQPSGWAICGSRTPVIPIAENADSGKFIGSCSPVIEFNFEEEMAKLKKLSESPALNLYSGRRMFAHSNQSEDQSSAPAHETGGTANFMCNFGQFDVDRQTNESGKTTNQDFGFGNLFTFGNRNDSNDLFSFFGHKANEAESSSNKSGKDGASSSDDVFKLFGGSDAESTMSRQKEAGSEGSCDIFNMFASGGNASASTSSSSKDKSDDAGGFFNFGAKPVNDGGPAKSQFKFF